MDAILFVKTSVLRVPSLLFLCLYVNWSWCFVFLVVPFISAFWVPPEVKVPILLSYAEGHSGLSASVSEIIWYWRDFHKKIIYIYIGLGRGRRQLYLTPSFQPCQKLFLTSAVLNSSIATPVERNQHCDLVHCRRHCVKNFLISRLNLDSKLFCLICGKGWLQNNKHASKTSSWSKNTSSWKLLS